jgi:TatD DNase family protein
MLLNIHTHHTTNDLSFAIVNRLKDFDVIPETGFYSAGLHPWFLENGYRANLSSLEKAIQNPRVLAVGECGLDTICRTDYPLQQQCFRLQVQMANRCGKPLILHCVKAFDDVQRILKEEKAVVPVIFHGYHKSGILALQLIKSGYYLSFGKSLWQAATAAVFKTMALNRIFLETDTADLEISEVYARASFIKQISITQLQEVMAANAKQVFGLNLPAYE